MSTIHPGFPATSIFYGRDIKARVHVDWGTFSLVAALKELIMSALEDRLNQKFMLISESGIPLYPGETMWVELMVEEKSRINACELGVRSGHPLPLFPYGEHAVPFVTRSPFSSREVPDPAVRCILVPRALISRSCQGARSCGALRRSSCMAQRRAFSLHEALAC